MSNTKETDLLILSRNNQTYKTTIDDLMSVNGNISIGGSTGKKSINLTVDIKDPLENFGSTWSVDTQAQGRLYVNTGSGSVHESWDYIGGNKADATIDLVIGTTPTINGGYLISSLQDNDNLAGLLNDGTFKVPVTTSQGGGKSGELTVTVSGHYITEVKVTNSGKLIDSEFIEHDFYASDNTGPVVVGSNSIVQLNDGSGYTAGGDCDTDNVSSSGSGLKVRVTTNSGKIDSVAVIDGGDGYAPGDIVKIKDVGGGDVAEEVQITLEDITLNYTNTTKKVKFELNLFNYPIDVNLDFAGSGFNTDEDAESDVYGGSSSGLEVKYTTNSDGEVNTVELLVVTSGYLTGDKLYIKSSGSGKYGLTVSGSEVVTWLGKEKIAGSPQPDEGWVLFTTLASGDDDGFVRKEGDHMFGTLFMDDMATPETPAISARNNIVTDMALYGQNVTVTDFVSGANLSISENSTFGGYVSIGEENTGSETTIFNKTTHHQLAGYIKVDPLGENVIIPTVSGEDTVQIGRNDFVTKQYVDVVAGGGGPAGNNVEYTLNIPVQSDGSSALDYSEIEIVETDLTTLVSSVKGAVKLTPGPNIKLISDDSGDAIEIGADATRVIFSEVAPAYEEGQLWYNTTDGRIYVAYTDEGALLPGGDPDPELPATEQWVDASPSAINGGDYVYRYGDQVENYLLVNGYFNATHYDLGLLPDIGERV